MNSNKIKDTAELGAVYKVYYVLKENLLRKLVNRKYLAVFQLAVIISFLVYWINFNSNETGTNLWILFFYCFPSEFLIGFLPHEPILLFFGKFYDPIIVASISIAGTVLAEGLNYSFFSLFAQNGYIQKINNKKIVIRITNLFKKAPFLAIWIAGFTPIPFYPIRFLVVTTNYPIYKYLLGVFLSRYPRFYLLALVGFLFEIPNWFILALFIVLIIFVYLQFIRILMEKSSKKDS